MSQNLQLNNNKLNDNTKAQIPVTYCNITSSFSGIGHILLDINSVILTAVKKYSLNLKTCPNQRQQPPKFRKPARQRYC